MEAAIADVKDVLPESITEDKKRWYAIKFLENDEKVKESIKLSASAQSTVDSKRQAIEKKHDDDMESIVTDERYTFIQKIVNTTVKKGKDKLTVSDKIDRIVTNRILGIPIFIAIMWLVYYVSVTTVGTFVTDWTNDVFVVAIQDFASNILGSIGAGDMVMGLVVDGIMDSFLRWRSCSCSCPSLKTVVTWYVSHLLWTVYSVTSDFPVRASFRSLFLLDAVSLESWLPRPSSRIMTDVLLS